MRLEKLVLRRYGHFTDFKLDFGNEPAGKSDLHVLYGPNEAGKSTTLAAITDLLFGFEYKTRWNFLHHNDVLEIEAVLCQASERVGLKRLKNRLTSMSDERLEHLPLDLQGLSRDDFTRRFSFDEQALQEGGEQILNSQGDVGHALFSASAGLSNLKTLLDAAMENADSFWKPGQRKNNGLIALKNELKEKHQQLKSIKLDATAYNKRLGEREMAESRKNEYRREYNEITQHINDIEQKIKASAFAMRYREHAERRRALESEGVIAIDCPGPLQLDTGTSARAALEKTRQQVEEIRQARQVRAGQERQRQSYLQRREELEPDVQGKKILAVADRIKALSAESSAGYEWLQQLAETQSTIDMCDQRINAFVERFSLDALSSLESCLPGKSQLSELRTLLSQEQSLRDRLVFTQEELGKLDPATEEPDPATEQHVSKDNIELLESVSARIQQAGLVRELEIAETNLLEAKQQASTQAAQLGLSLPSLHELDIPESDWLNSRLTELTSAREEASRLQSEIISLRKEIGVKQAACRNLERLGALDRNHWQRQKLERDEAWQAHTAAIDNQAPPLLLQQSARVFQTSMHGYDEQTVVAIEKSDETAKLVVLQEQIEVKQQELEVLEVDTLPALEKRVQLLSQGVLDSVSTFHRQTEVEPDLLRQRFVDAKKLKDALIAYDKRKLELEQIRQRCDEACQSLLGLLQDIHTGQDSGGGEAGMATLGLQDLLPYASSTLTSAKQYLQEQQQARTERSRQRAAFADRSNAVRDAESALAQWKESWNRAIVGTVFASLTLAQARDTLPDVDTMRSVLERRREALDKTELLRKRMATRDESVAALLTELQCESLEEANEQLQQLQKNREFSQNLDKDIEETRTLLDNSKSKLDLQLAELEQLRQAYGCACDDELLACLARTEQHRVANDNCVDNLEQLYRLTDQRFDEAAVDQLINDHDRGELTVQLQKYKDRHADLSASLEKANEVYALANQAVEDIDDSSEYARLVQQQRNILLEIEEQVRRTMIARTGRCVLLAAMARFRQENQSTILSQAQQAFSTLTLGKYVRLLPREDGRGREQLYAVDSSEKARAVNELSTGTRYQLYLALRAAAYADYARQRTPLPFVADDIMESFDDDRSAAAFRVMGRMAEFGQVLYLTHHTHLLDIAKEVLGEDGVQIHYYQGAVSTS